MLAADVRHVERLQRRIDQLEGRLEQRDTHVALLADENFRLRAALNRARRQPTPTRPEDHHP